MNEPNPLIKVPFLPGQPEERGWVKRGKRTILKNEAGTTLTGGGPIYAKRA